MKTIDKITISLALMAAFVVGAFLDDAIAQPVTVQKVRYINRPIYQMLRQDAHFREPADVRDFRRRVTSVISSYSRRTFGRS